MIGRKAAGLVGKEQEAGTYRVGFGAEDLSSWTYLYRLTAGGFAAAKKMTAVK